MVPLQIGHFAVVVFDGVELFVGRYQFEVLIFDCRIAVIQMSAELQCWLQEIEIEFSLTC